MLINLPMVGLGSRYRILPVELESREYFHEDYLGVTVGFVSLGTHSGADRHRFDFVNPKICILFFSDVSVIIFDK